MAGLVIGGLAVLTLLIGFCTIMASRKQFLFFLKFTFKYSSYLAVPIIAFQFILSEITDKIQFELMGAITMYLMVLAVVAIGGLFIIGYDEN